MDRFYLLAPAFILSVAFVTAFLVYCGLHIIGRPPRMIGVKHNQLIGPFLAGFMVWLIGPVERMLIGRVSPNWITAGSLLMCAATGVAAALGQLATAMWFFIFAGMLDILDGRLARLAGTQTATGALFDSVSDRWGELFVFLGYAWFLHDSLWLLASIGALGASMMVSYTRARAEGLGVEMSNGMMQRAERIFLVCGGNLIAVLYGRVDSVAEIMGSTMLILTATSTATALNRWVVAFRVLAKRAAEPVVAEAPPTLPLQPITQPLPSLSASDLRKVRPLEQH